MVKNIVRSILVCVIGFLLTIIGYEIFFAQGDRGDILVGLLMFVYYGVFLGYSLVVENILFFVYKRNHLNAFLVTYSIAFIYILFCVFSAHEIEDLIGVISCSVFLILQIGGFYYSQKKAHKIKKGKNWTV